MLIFCLIFNYILPYSQKQTIINKGKTLVPVPNLQLFNLFPALQLILEL